VVVHVPATDVVSATVQVNDALLEPDWASVNVTLTVVEPPEGTAVGTPLMMPVAGSMVMPAGRPVADQVAVVEGSKEPVGVAESAIPMMLDWLPGEVTETVSTFQLSEMVPAVPLLPLPTTAMAVPPALPVP
jgi:hypothetical protein